MALTEKYSLTLTLPLVARRIFTSMLNSTCSHVISSMAQSLLCQAPSASSPSRHGRMITHQPLLQPNLIYSLLVKRSPSAHKLPWTVNVCCMNQTEKNCIHEASSHTMT